MSYYDEDLDDDYPEPSGRSDDETVNIAAPWVVILGATHTRRYDLRAQLAKRCQLPKGDLTDEANRLLDDLYDVVAGEWAAGSLHAGDAKMYLRRAMAAMGRGDLEYLAAFLKLDRTQFTTTTAGYSEDVRVLIAGRLERRVAAIVGQAVRKTRGAAA